MGIEQNSRNRTIKWSIEIDALAERLASERGLKTHPRRGVSELLEQLVSEEAANPRLKLQEPSEGYKAKIKGKKAQKLKNSDASDLRRATA